MLTLALFAVRTSSDWGHQNQLFLNICSDGSSWPIGRIPPAEADANDHAAERDLDRVAWFKPDRRRQIRHG
jgi:hypothetical protein